MYRASKPLFLLFAVTLVGASLGKEAGTPSPEAPEYTADAQLKLPQNYREWVYLTSDYYDAVSGPSQMQTAGQRKFNNIFVNPEAYRAFLETGMWPDKTMLVVEQRAADDIGSPNPKQKGAVQSSQIGLALHVKDEARFPGKWAFFGFPGGSATAKMIPVTAGCYSCHATRGATDTTFVQFYPTLLPVAKSRNTLSSSYLQKLETPSSTAK
ncbi:MAG TPA: cytochrome P460 family protein [Acidobacteriaceae bacterium]|nr:cytochrome P460 family protein [Acidobacteriaceae bacterium]